MKTCCCGKKLTKRGQCVTPIKLKPGALSMFGYEDIAKKSELARHRALLKAIRFGEPPLSLYRRLNALMVLTKRTQPKLSKIYRMDRDWIGKKYGYGTTK